MLEPVLSADLSPSEYPRKQIDADLTPVRIGYGENHVGPNHVRVLSFLIGTLESKGTARP